ncbi:MAG: alpha-mannosidase, partial [Bacteroidota bacterium]|nr:alpha-mannosidase [Bacteroidota bacterium]
PAGDYTKMYILASANDDTKGDFVVDDKTCTLNVQGWSGYVGQFYNRKFALDGETVTNIDKPYFKKDNIAWYASHRHQAYPSKNEAYQYTYIYKYEIDLPRNAKSITLPKNNRIKIFAISLAKDEPAGTNAVQSLTDDFTNSSAFVLKK